MRDLIRVERGAKSTRVWLDGEELADIPRDAPVRVDVQPDVAPTVTVTLMANRVEVVDDLDALAPSPGKSL